MRVVDTNRLKYRYQRWLRRLRRLPRTTWWWWREIRGKNTRNRITITY